jgi:2-octaprenyl-6-methoxyphenol hydroxylase
MQKPHLNGGVFLYQQISKPPATPHQPKTPYNYFSALLFQLCLLLIKITICDKEQLMPTENFDIIVSGAGYTGLTLALGLQKLGLKVAIINQSKPFIPTANSAERLFAIANESVNILSEYGVAGHFKDKAQPINQVLIVDDAGKEDLIFTATELDMPNFGLMVGEGNLMKALKQKNNLPIIADSISEITHNPAHVSIKLAKGNIITASLLIVAEGKRSKVKHMLGWQDQMHDYKQDAIVFDIEHSKDHQGIALEKFLPTGPIAILPKKGGFSSCIVWTDKNGTGKLMQEMPVNDVEFLLMQRLSRYIGDIKITSTIGYFPLQLSYSRHFYENRIIFCGDAIHSIHPIAGQGLNLGLRDVKTLIDIIQENKDLGLDIGSDDIGQAYQKQRNFDINLMIDSTHHINYIFSNNLLPVKLLRKAGLNIIKKIPALKNYIMSYASGSKY